VERLLGAFRAYSPYCLEGVFSEVRLHDPAWIVFERPETSPIASLPGSRQDLHLVVVDKNAENRDIR
jgi:hypothetical protein